MAVGRAVETENRRWTRQANGAEFDPVPQWHPSQLRHAAEIAAMRDSERARPTLGHSATMPANYVRSADGKLTAEVALRIG